MKLKLAFVAALVAACLTSACSVINDNPPDYIKEFAIYREGVDGFQVYFVLADKSGRPTSSEGWVYLTLCLPSSKENKIQDHIAYIHDRKVTKSDFKKVTIGASAFERESLAYVFDRIEDYDLQDNLNSFYNLSLREGIKAKNTHKPDSILLKGKEGLAKLIFVRGEYTSTPLHPDESMPEYEFSKWLKIAAAAFEIQSLLKDQRKTTFVTEKGFKF
jgi:hypothetical protein